MLPTESAAERRVYEAFERELPDGFVCFHGRRFTLLERGRPPVEREADFIVAHPDLGVLVVEVKGGEVAHDPARGRWTQTDRSGTHDLDEDPFSQAQGAMHAFAQALRARPGSRGWMPSYGYAVAFPDGEYRRDAHPGAPARLVLDRRHLARPEPRIVEIMRSWAREDRPFGPEGMAAVAEALGAAVSTRVPLSVLWREQRTALRRLTLTRDQQWLRDLVLARTRAAVTGPAGSGKTVLAIAVARALAERGNRVLLTCFNTALAGYLGASVADEERIEVSHFHRLCFRSAEEAGLPVSATERIADGDPYFETVLPDLLMRASDVLGPRYDAVVVDEAQDFRELWWPALLSMHEDPDGGLLYLFADSAQNLYGGALPLDEADVLPPLVANLRNTRAIGEFVGRFYGGRAPEPDGPEGRPVVVRGYEDTDELASLLAEDLERLVGEDGMRLRDIVLLTPSRRAKSELRARDGVGRFRFLDLQEVLAGDAASIAATEEALLTATIHKYKGLEAPVVLLAEIGERHAEELDTYLYVGASRASSLLLVYARRPVDETIRRR